MSAIFDPHIGVVALVLLAALIAAVLTWRNARRNRGLLVLLQLPCAALLLAALLLRDDPGSDTLVLLTQGTDAAALEEFAMRPLVIALPGTTDDARVESAPDLATALRRHAPVRRLHIVGDGLARNDREAAQSLDISIESAAAPRDMPASIVELQLPDSVQAGAAWTLHGRTDNAAGKTIELRDPSYAAVATANVAGDGGFRLGAVSRAAGPALFELRLLDGERTLQALPVPIDANAAPPLRVLLLASAPSPELKYVRRWALDAGVALESRIDLAPNLRQRRGTPALDAAALAELDLLIVDERSWVTLAAQQSLLRDAIANGLGVLLRVTGPLPERTRREWAQLGVDVSLDGTVPRAIRFASPASNAAATDGLHAWPLRFAANGAPLLRDADGAALGQRFTLGQGRIGVLALADSAQLVTRGDGIAFATVWSEMFGALARARGAAGIEISARPVVGERVAICNIASAADVRLPVGDNVTLVVDPATDGCAGFWPTVPGWHRVRPAAGDGVADRMFYVHAPADIASLQREDTMRATRALANRADAPVLHESHRDGWRAALLAGWLLLASLCWWLERRAKAYGP